jgi:hypothetical protein
VDIKFCINTVNTFSERTLPVIIPSMLNSGIEKKDIYIFEGGHLDRRLDDYDGIFYMKVDHNSLEYTGMIEIVENEIEADYWFNTHDTAIMGRDFARLVRNIPHSMPDKVALKPYPSMSIGSYKYSYLMSKKEILLSIKNHDYSREKLLSDKAWGVSNEDFILWKNNETETHLYNEDAIPDAEYFEVVDYVNIYGGDTVRIKEYYPQLDISKMKSNWGQSAHVGVDL